MSKLSMLDLSQRNMPAGVTTPTVSMSCITAEKTILPDEVVEKLRRQAKRKPRRQKAIVASGKRVLKRTVMFVFGHENISVYLLLTEDSEKNENLIKNLVRTAEICSAILPSPNNSNRNVLRQCKACQDSIVDLERHFEQCLDSVPQTQLAPNTTNEAYSYLQLHSVWETLQHGGAWSGVHVDLLNTMHSNFTEDYTVTDITAR